MSLASSSVLPKGLFARIRREKPSIRVSAIVVESASRLFLRNTIALPLPRFVAPGINAIVQDGEVLEIDYAANRARNVATGAAVAIPKFPPLIEKIYECGGLPQLARQRYLAETAR